VQGIHHAVRAEGEGGGGEGAEDDEDEREEEERAHAWGLRGGRRIGRVSLGRWLGHWAVMEMEKEDIEN